MYVPYADISEVNGLGAYLTPETLRTYEEYVKTPVAFASYADRYGRRGTVLKTFTEGGWEHVTGCLNWHTGHMGDAEILLFMKKFEKNLPLEKGFLRQHSYSQHLSFASGCCGRIIEPKEIEHPELLRVNPTWWTRYLTLLRVPTEQSVDGVWLREMNYRPLPRFSTSVADYWVNGFQDWTRDAELDFWGKWKKPGAAAVGEKRASLYPKP